MIQFPHFRLKKWLAAILLCSSTCIAMAQTDSAYRQLSDARQRSPLFVINNTIIGTPDINPQDIDSMKVFKGDGIPKRLFNLSKYGIIAIYLKKGIKIKTRSFNEIREWLDIKEGVRFAIDGFYVDDTNLLISIAAICRIDVIKKSDGGKRVPDVINIWTIDPGFGKGDAPHNPGNLGEIYIR